MAEFVPINGKLLAFGLTWVTISHPKKEASERISLARAGQAEYVARYSGKVGREIKYGLAKRVIEEIGDQPKGSILSAALLFSEHIGSKTSSENSLLVFQIDEKNVAIIALLKGAPYLDLVVKMGDLDNQLASLYQEGHAAFALYSNLAAYSVNVISSNDLLEGNTKLAALARFTDPFKKALRIGMIVCAIGVVAGLANWKITKNKREAQTATQNVVDPIQVYMENRQRLLANASFNGEVAAQVMWDVIKKREVTNAGWSLKNITCTPQRCEEHWQQNNGSYPALRATVHAPQTVTLQQNSETSVITYPLTGKRTALDFTTLQKKDALWIDLISQQQRLKRINPALVFTPKPAELRGITPTILVDSVPAEIRVYAGEITIHAPLGLASDLLQHHLNHVMINEIAIDTLSNVQTASVQIKGTYYAQH